MDILRKWMDSYNNYPRFCDLNKRNLPIGFYSEIGTDRIYELAQIWLSEALETSRHDR